MKRNVLIIEDSKTSGEALTEMTRKCDTVGAIFCVDNSADAYERAMETEIDLFIVSIIMETDDVHDVPGFRFVDMIRKCERYEFTPVIFITSLVDEKMYAFHKLHCFDYIEKPFYKADVEKVIETALRVPLTEDREQDMFSYRKDGVLQVLNVDKIIYLESRFRSVFIYTLDETVALTYTTLKQVLDKLPRRYFLRCSRNEAVNKNFIKYVDTANHFVGLTNGKQLKLGANMKKEFMENMR